MVKQIWVTDDFDPRRDEEVFDTEQEAKDFEQHKSAALKLDDLYHSSRHSGGEFIVRHWAQIKALMEPTTDATK